MNAFELTNNCRTELLAYVKSILDGKSYVWVNNLLSDINKKMLINEDAVFNASVIMMYKNMKKFFTKYCKNVIPSNILLSFYVCALELGLKKLGDEIESFSQFTEDVDLDDWSKVTVNDIKKFDIETNMLVLRKSLGYDDVDIRACGICTLQALDFYE